MADQSVTPRLAQPNSSAWRRGLRLASVFLSGQALIQLGNFLVGVLLVRLLTVEEYALYTVGGALLAVIALGAHMGVPQAIITLASKQSDPNVLRALVHAAIPQCTLQYLLTIPFVLVLAVLMIGRHDWSVFEGVACVALVVVAGWFRVPSMVAGAVMNLRHDSLGLFRAGMAESLTRVALLPVCIIWPKAMLALLANLAGAAMMSWASLRRVNFSIDPGFRGDPVQLAAIRAFTVPLVPTIVYHALQGQISVIVLSLFGKAASVAQVGAISRLNQLVMLALMLNPFLVQPVLARQTDRQAFARRLTVILGVIAVFIVITLTSATLVPDWWLWLLGSKYTNLRQELPVALAAGLATLTGATLYTAVIARNRTSGQFWAIILSVGGQLVFASAQDVTIIRNALVLNLIPALAYATVQAVILIRVMMQWPLGASAMANAAQ
jgi:O-antigen/teichoic acid export membrane protein